jgi:thiol-disulfide isomerase/thioredoxin
MKKLTMFAAAILCALAVNAAEPISNGPIVPGEWNSRYREAFDYAVANNIPFITVISRPAEACHFCEMFHDKWTSKTFLEWAKGAGMIMGVLYTNDPYGYDQAWCDWARGKNTGYPFIRIYWQKSDGSVVSDLFMGRNSSLGDVDGDGKLGTQSDFIARIEKNIDGWNSVKYYGGEFAYGADTEGDRLEADAGTTNVILKLVRDENAAENASTNTLTVSYPGKKNLLSAVAAGEGDTAIAWSVGETEKMVNVAVDPSRLEDGDAITLTLLDEEGEEHATSHIWFVEPENSAKNPYWFGEKEDLGFGEWTMDLDAAKELVAGTDGEAYTLVLVEGALWCGDCKNVETYFLDATDEKGENIFSAWAKKNNVALVAVDTPNFTNETAYTRPSLLVRDDVLGNGVSGLGYLTRKMVSEEEAAEALEWSRQLCVKNTYEGGFHRPEDFNANRPGVPCFVMLRKDGSVATRLTRWSTVSTTVINPSNREAFYNRFNEMLAMASSTGEHADPLEIENNYPGESAIELVADGGDAVSELSHTDMRDVFRLVGVGGNALQKIVVSGETNASVKVSFLTTNELGKAVAIGEPVSGSLLDGVPLEHVFTSAGDYFVLVEGKSVTDAEWAIENKAADNFIPYQVSGDVVLVPQEGAAIATATHDTVFMRISKDVDCYRIEGLDVKAAVESGNLEQVGGSDVFFKAKVSGDVELTVENGPGTDVKYQIWNPGTVGFTSASRVVNENDGGVFIEIARVDGTSGEFTATLSIDWTETVHEDSDGVKRFVPFEAFDITWRDGETYATNVVVTLLDDDHFDGPGKIVLNLEKKAGDDMGATVEGATFTLSVKDNDRSAPGTAAFVESGTVYFKASEGATVHAVRNNASDGEVTVNVETTAGTLDSDVVAWAHRETAATPVRLTGLAAGKSATLTLKAGEGGITVPVAGRRVKVVAVSDDGPEFDVESATLNLTRNVATSYFAEVDTQTFESGSTLVFTKKSGTLPAGLTARWDGESALFISGTPTKAGEYTAVYQVSVVDGASTIAGLTTTLTFNIIDMAAPAAPGEQALNPAIVKTRTFKDVMIMDGNTLKGLLQVTVPSTGRASAKYVSADGAVSLSSKSWTAADYETGAVTATLWGTASTTADWTLDLVAEADGTVSLSLNEAGELVGAAVLDGNVWSADNTAETYKGYYTVALPVSSVDAEAEELAQSGTGYLTVNLRNRSELNNGTARWAGLLPNGTAVSGSSVLTADEGKAYLPIFVVSSKDTVAGALDILENAAKLREENEVYNSVTAGSSFMWSHTEPEGSDGSYTASLGVTGCLFDKSDNLEACCDEFFNGSTNMWLVVEGTDNTSKVTVTANNLKLEKAENQLGATLGYSQSTGVATGKVRVDGKNWKWRGVVLIGLGGCNVCSTGSEDPSYPLLSGVAFRSETIAYETLNNSGKEVVRRATLKFGRRVKIDTVTTFE